MRMRLGGNDNHGTLYNLFSHSISKSILDRFVGHASRVTVRHSLFLMAGLTHGTKNPLSFGKNLNTAVENKWIIVVLLGVGDNRR